MEIIGKIMLYIILICCVAGAVASVIKEDSELGRSFEEGLQTIGSLFLPVIGLMVSVPYLKIFVQNVLGPLFNTIGADPAVGATMLVSSDVGGYLLARQIAQTPETWIIAMIVGLMAAPVIAFNIPVGLSLLDKKDHHYLAFGAMSGIIAIPFGVLTSCLLIYFFRPSIRTEFATTGPSTYQLALDLGSIFINLLPLTVFCALLALGLRYIPDKMIKGFMIYGKILMSALKLIVAFSIVEYYSGFFSKTFGSWGFSPVMADGQEPFRAVELIGVIAMMLAGAFPMVYLVQKYLHKPLAMFGNLVGLSPVGSTGLLAASANVVAMYKLIEKMPPNDKILCIAYSVCGGYVIGDWLAYITNFQPTLLFATVIGQLTGGILGILIAKKISLPHVQKIEYNNRLD